MPKTHVLTLTTQIFPDQCDIIREVEPVTNILEHKVVVALRMQCFRWYIAFYFEGFALVLQF